MNHAQNAGAAEPRPASGWTIHSGGRQFGPLSDEELRRYFSSGMVKHGDSLTHPSLDAPKTAQEVALHLQVASPVPTASTGAPLPPSVRHLSMAPAPSNRRTVALFAVALALGAVYWLMPKEQPRPARDASPSFAQADAPASAPARDPAFAPAEPAPSPAAFAWPDPSQVQGKASGAPSKRRETIAPDPFTVTFFDTGEDESRPGQRADWYAQARRLDEAGNWSAALVHARQWTEHEPNRPEAWRYLARAERELGHDNDALRDFHRAAALAPDDFWVSSNLASLYFKTKDYEHAEDWYRNSLRIEPRNGDAWTWLANDLLMQNRRKEAVAAYAEAARVDPGNFRRWDSLCYQQYQAGDHGPAVASCEKAIALNPNDGYARGMADWARTH